MIGAFSCNYKKDIETCTNTVELPIPHIWGDEQVAGTATFVDDMLVKIKITEIAKHVSKFWIYGAKMLEKRVET